MLAFGLSLSFTLSTAGAVDLDPKTQSAIPGDFNGDGRMDALLQPLTAREPGAIVLQDGTGKLTVLAQQWDAGYLGLDWSATDSTLTAADLNGDGQDDVVMQPRKTGGTGAVLFTDPSIQLLRIGQLLPAGYLGLDWSSADNVITAGDFDGDRQKELLLQSTQKGGPAVMVHAAPTGQIVVVMQQFADGFLGRHWDAKDETFYVGDFNGDGRQDLLVQSHLNGKGEAMYALLLADPNGLFSHVAETWNQKDLGANWNPANHKIVISDANHDGIMDITLQSTDGGTSYLFEGNAQGQFTQAAAHWTGNQSASDVLNTGTKKSGTGTGVISVIPSGGATSLTIVAPSPNPEQGSTSERSGSTAPGSGEIMTVNAAGRLVGSGGVSGGTATYSIPLAVPPGIHGMQPSVSLSYSSRGGNGEMGMGWSLNAGSQIHRCPATQAMDGYSSGVTYTANDRLCLDGQHLIAVSGTYGTNGATYRTELDAFSLITEIGDISSGTSHFTVDTKDGHELRYGWGTNIGSSPNAVFTPSGAPAPLAWAEGMEVDQHNNSIIYYYSTYGTGEYLLTSIKYTGAGATAGNREIDFAYNTRGDVSGQYLAGGLTQQTQLLSSVSTSENGAAVRTYNVEYTASAATGRSLVAGVQECGVSGGAQSCLPETTFTWHQPALHFSLPSAIDESDTCASGLSNYPGPPYISTPGDLNGDGYKDIMVQDSCGATVYLMGPGGVPSSTAISVSGFNTSLVNDVVDIDGDGTADLLGPMSSQNALGYTRYDPTASAFTTVKALYKADGTTIPYTETFMGNTYASIVAVKDVDGDGLPDIVVVMPDPNTSGNHMLAVYKNITPSCFTVGCHPTPKFATTPIRIFSVADQPSLNFKFLAASSVGDMDGNGLPDFAMGYYTSDNVQHSFWVFTQNTGGTLSFTFMDQRNDGRNVTQAWGATMMDINGDGLPDAVYDCGANNGTDLCYALNTGNTGTFLFGAEVDTGVHDWRAASQLEMGGSVTADIDNDGAQEIIFPETLLDEYCEHDIMIGGNSFDECAYSTAHTLSPSMDFSIYQYSEIKFTWQQLSGGTYAYVPSKLFTGIDAQAHLAAPVDLLGDGLTGVASSFTKVYNDSYWNPQSGYTRPIGLHVAANTSGGTNSVNAAPDLMLTSNDGFNHTENWDYYPLTSAASFNGMPLYASPGASGNGYAGGDYFYFSSSMYVVGDYIVDNGAGTTNEHDFHYGQAIYNNQGRGFQGFRTVVDDDMTQSTWPNTARARTVQVYHQRFPLSGTLQESWTTTQATAVDLGVDPTMDSNAIDHVKNTWGCMQGSQAQMTVQETIPITCDSSKLTAATYAPVLLESVETHFDVSSHDPLSSTDTQYCPASGLGCSGTGATRGYDAYGNSLGSVSVTTDAYGTYTGTANNTYDITDTADWWVDKLKEKVTDVKAAYVGQTAGAEVTRTTDYDYYTTRDLNHVYAYADGNAANQITTHYSYSGAGNVIDVNVSGGSGATAVAARVTATTYTTGADTDYFVASVTDPIGLTTSYAQDPRFGEPTSVTAPDGVVTSNSYDAFGRVISTQVGSLPAQTTQYITHTSTDGMCNNTTAVSTYYALVNQTGYPSHYTCYDSLNRPIRVATESFASTSDLVFQSTDYNVRGQAFRTTEPHFSSQGETWNVNTYEQNILERVSTHTDAKGVVTAYSYNDLVTDIETTTPNDTLNPTYARQDEEKKNSLGKLLTVTNAVGAAEQAATSYQYDSDGNPVTITAADTNQITAVYDVLGHKTSVTDPDQGTTIYTYDVLGELLTQTDAKSQTLTMAYDADGRMTAKSSSVSGEDPVAWTYDTCSAGKVCSVTQGDGTHYQENYSYDGMGRVKTDEEVIDTVPYDTDTSYDADGRVDTVTYPDSIADAAPVVSAGSTQYVPPGATVTLSGSATDADSGPQAPAFQWSQTAGPSVSLSSNTAASPTFTASTTIGTSYTFQLTADDGLVTSAPASVNVVVPVLPAAPGGLTDSGDTDHDGTYTVSWSSVSVPGTTITYSLEEATGTATTPGTWSQIYSGSALTTSVSHPGNGSYYYWYRVRAQDSVSGTVLGYGPYSATDSINVVVTPSAPASIAPTSASASGSYEVTWVSGGGKTTYYDLDITPQGGTASQIYSGANSFYIVPAQTQGLYHFKVRACNKSTTSGLTECSAYTGGASVTWTGSGGGSSSGGGGQPQGIGGGGGNIPVPPPGTVGTVIPAAKPIDPGHDSAEFEVAAVRTAPKRSASPSGRHDVQGRTNVAGGMEPRATTGENGNPVPTQLASTDPSPMRARPRFAPPVYKAWASAHLQNATGGAPVVRFAVKHIYTANGYLWQLTSAVDTKRVYWMVNDSDTSNTGMADPQTGNYYERGMDAHGNVVDSLYGAGTSTTQITNHAAYDPNSSYLMYMKSKSVSGTTTYQDLAYQWYVIGNLYTRASNPTTDNVNTLSETFAYDLHNRLLSSAVTNAAGPQPALTQAYDSVGDIMCKSDVVGSACTVGSTGYTYGGTAGPHAVTAAGGNTYTYDANGNMTSRSVTVNGHSSNEKLTWNSDNLPTCIDDVDGTCTGGANTNSSAFSYAPDKHRYKQIATTYDGTTSTSETTLYVGGLDIITDSSGTWYRHTISAYGKPVLLETLSNNTSGAPKEDKHYLLNDHLGSVDTVVRDSDSTVVPRESFDAFGQRRDKSTWYGAMNATDLANARKVTHRGFTHHEQLDNLAGLVHANGRVLDSVTGRFLSVDPIYEAPTNSQSINPYSYVMNNSLSFTDPSGYDGCFAGELCLSGGGNNRDEKGNLLPYVKVVSPDTDVSKLKKGEVVSVNGQLVAALGGGGIAVGNGAILNQQVTEGLNRIAQTADLLGTSNRSSFMNIDVGVAMEAGGSDGELAALQANGGKTVAQVDAEMKSQDTRTMVADNTSSSHPLGYYLPNLEGGVWDAITGFGDGAYKGVTFGVGDLSAIRDAAGITGSIDESSEAYRYGKVAGYAEGGAASAGSLAKGAASLARAATGLRVFRSGSWLNSGQHLRIGVGKSGPDNPGRWVFRISGDWVPTESKHIDLMDLGPRN